MLLAGYWYGINIYSPEMRGKYKYENSVKKFALVFSVLAIGPKTVLERVSLNSRGSIYRPIPRFGLPRRVGLSIKATRWETADKPAQGMGNPPESQQDQINDGYVNTPLITLKFGDKLSSIFEL